MAGLRRQSIVRHATVGVTVAGAGVLGAAGVLGGGFHPERYDGWQVVVAPAGGDALRIREVYDQDFGTTARHGHERTIPDDYGAPTDIEVSSPDAPDDLDVDTIAGDTRIRIGDPDTTITGQHRYVLAYTLPEAELSQGRLELDLIEEHEFDVDRVEAIVTGLELAEPVCVVGQFGDTTECPIVDDGSVYRIEIDALAAGTGITVYGDIVGRRDVVDVPEPALPARRGDRSVLAGAGLGVLSAAVVTPIYLVARRRGSNEVFAGGAADAAFGSLPAPGTSATPSPAVRLVSDDELGELATTEFVPPDGLEPWEAAALLTERFGNGSVVHYLSGLAGSGAIELTEVDDGLSIARGPRWSELTDPADRALLERIWALGDPYVAAGKYDAGFAAAWREIRTQLGTRLSARGWWKRGTPTARYTGVGVAAIAVLVAVGTPIAIGALSANGFGALARWPVAIALAVLVPGFVAVCAYATLLPARSARGSALALRAESFRRFLEASEGRHVEWAWQQGLLREYSAWAVALGAADAWSRALAAANVPEPQQYTTPLLALSHQRSLSSSYTKPSSSSSSSGGFSGGVGGGGGGGSSGSW